MPSLQPVEPRVLLSPLGPGRLRPQSDPATRPERAGHPATMAADYTNGLIPDRVWDEWNRETLDRLARGEGRAPVLFFGDSLTAAWLSRGQARWDSLFAPLGAANFGIAGSLTQNLHWLLASGGLADRPPVVVVQIGINNLYAAHDTPRDTAMGVYAILREIRQQSPRTEVLLLGIYPPNAPAWAPISQAVAETNALIATYARRCGARFVDLGPALRGPDGNPNPSLYQDELHLNAVGYDAVAPGLIGPLGQLLAQSSGPARPGRVAPRRLGGGDPWQAPFPRRPSWLPTPPAVPSLAPPADPSAGTAPPGADQAG